MKRISVLVLMVSLFVFSGFAADQSTQSVEVVLDTGSAITQTVNVGISDTNISNWENIPTSTLSEIKFLSSDLDIDRYIWWVVETGEDTNVQITLASKNKSLKDTDDHSILYSVKYGTFETNDSCSITSVPQDEIVTAENGVSFTVTKNLNKYYGTLSFTARVKEEDILKAHTGESYSDTLTVTITTDTSGI